MVAVRDNDLRVILFYGDYNGFGIQQRVDLPAVNDGPDL